MAHTHIHPIAGTPQAPAIGFFGGGGNIEGWVGLAAVWVK